MIVYWRTKNLLQYCLTFFTSVEILESLLDSRAKKFIRFINDLCELIVERLLIKPEEERRRMVYLSQVLKRARQSHDMIINLQAKLKEEESNVAKQV